MSAQAGLQPELGNLTDAIDRTIVIGGEPLQ
jgi:hypothetical protein